MSSQTQRIRGYQSELRRIFLTASSKHQAHDKSRRVLEDICGDRPFIGAVLKNYLSHPEVLNSKNYPVVGINVDLNSSYHLVANCWIPLPDRQSDVSTKAIHHHGTMLLTTATMFGPGYEHWLFGPPQEMDPAQELYAMKVTERKLHGPDDIAFVDAYEPHLPLFPSGMTVTLALWSNRSRTTWKDRLKRIPLLKRNEETLRKIAVRVGLTRSLDLKVVEYFDFYPTENGFKGMRERVEFGLGPNEDYLQSLFHILQKTENDRLAPLIENHVEAGNTRLINRSKIVELLQDLRHGRPIEGRLSNCHLNVPHAIFKSRDIERTLHRLNERS